MAKARFLAITSAVCNVQLGLILGVSWRPGTGTSQGQIHRRATISIHSSRMHHASLASQSSSCDITQRIMRIRRNSMKPFVVSSARRDAKLGATRSARSAPKSYITLVRHRRPYNFSSLTHPCIFGSVSVVARIVRVLRPRIPVRGSKS